MGPVLLSVFRIGKSPRGSEGPPLTEATGGERSWKEGREREMAPHAAVFHAVAFYLHEPHRNSRQQCFNLKVSGVSRRRIRFNHRPIIASAPSPSEMVDSEERAALERCFQGAPSSSSVSSLPTMKGNFGSFGAVTLEKSKLDLSQKTTRTSPEVESFDFEY